MASSTAVTKDYGKRVAIVTGAARGIGHGIALRLAQDGFSVCVNDIAANQGAIDEVVAEIKATGREACGFAADVSKEAEVQAMVAEVVERFGQLNVMVANAGIARSAPVLQMTEANIRQVFDVNFMGVFNCYKTAGNQMVKQGGGGKIIAAASASAFRPVKNLAHYSASKYAVRGLTQSFALEMAEHQITVNLYAPGIVDTPMWSGFGGTQTEAVKKMSDGVIPLGRPSVPEDVAKCVSYLASPDSDYMTGQTLVIDGGMVMH